MKKITVKKFIKNETLVAQTNEKYLFVDENGKIIKNIKFEIVNGKLYVYENENQKEPNLIIEDFDKASYYKHNETAIISKENYNENIEERFLAYNETTEKMVLAEEVSSSTNYKGMAIGLGVAGLVGAGLLVGKSKSGNGDSNDQQGGVNPTTLMKKKTLR